MFPGTDGDELLTPGQVAKLLGVSAKTVSNWAREGRLISFRTMGGHRRFRRSELERALRRWRADDQP